MTALEFAEVIVDTSARSEHVVCEPESVLDLAIIRKRVAAIKNGWSPDIAESRAVEGEKRRNELYRLLIEIEAGKQDCRNSPFGKSGRNKFGLVG